MRANLLRCLLLSFLCLCFVVSGCAADESTRLAGQFNSYQSVADTREMLLKAGMKDGWKEEIQGTKPIDQRPRYEILYMTGPFRLLGIEGQLRLTFYNGRLMETQFSTRKSEDFKAALRSENARVPEKPGVEIVTDVRTKFRFDEEPGGATRFTWYDPRLEAEWNKWVAEHS